MLAALLLLIGVAFGWGRRRGQREGFAAGRLYAPLELRRQALQRGACMLCGRAAEPPDEAPDGNESDAFALDNGDEPPL